MRKRRGWWAAGLLLLLATGGAVALWSGRPSLRVRVLSPLRGRIEQIVTATTVGTVEADRSAVVGAEMSGRILSIAVRQGTVREGQIVVTLDSSELEAEALRTTREVDAVRLERVQAMLQRDYSRDVLKRQEALDPSLRIEQEYERLKKELEIAEKKIEISDARLQMLDATRQQVEIRLAKSKVTAPFEGIVTELHAEVGETAAPGSPLFSLISAGPPLVTAQIDEMDMGQVRLGCASRVRFDSHPGRSFGGTVTEIMPAARTDAKHNRTVDVKIRLDSWPEGVVVGMSGHVELVTQTKEEAWYVPSHVVHDDYKEKCEYVYLVEGGTARKRKIRTGLSNWEYREVLDGVSPQSKLILPEIVDRQVPLEDGSPVTVDEH